MYHALTGRVPFDGPSVEETVWMHVKTRLVSPRKIVSAISKDTEAAVLRSMHKDPTKRYPNFKDIGIALEASWWTVGGETLAFVPDDPQFFADPDPVPAVAELADGGLRSMPSTRLR